MVLVRRPSLTFTFYFVFSLFIILIIGTQIKLQYIKNHFKGVVRLYNSVIYINSKNVISDLKSSLADFIFRSLVTT